MKVLNIGIPSVFDRSTQRENLMRKLALQVLTAGAQDLVTISPYVTMRRKSGGPTIAAKRLELIRECNALFHVQIDDDDDVSPDYVSAILEAINMQPGAFCIGHEILVKTPGQPDTLAAVSSSYKSWDHTFDGRYHYRQAPYYKVPILTKVLQAAGMDSRLTWQEDADHSRRLVPHLFGKPALFLAQPLYIYHSTPAGSTPAQRY